MARITYFVVLPFIRTEDGDLLGLEAEEAPSSLAATGRARGKVGREREGHKIVGAMAFSRTGDPQIGDFDDAVILGRYGETPDDIDGAE